MRDINSPASYSSGFLNSPITVYLPGTLKHPYNNPSANPPVGLYYDSETGELICTPVKSGEKSVLAFEIREWRNDSNGKAEMIGLTRRDVRINVDACASNNPPKITGGSQFNVCEEEELCIYMTTEDKVVVPPPPTPTPDPDTTHLYWNFGINHGATFRVLSDTVLNQTGEFCWTPPKGTASVTPYSFGVLVDDDNCNGPMLSHREYRIKVNAKPEAEISNTSLGCGRFALEAVIDTNLNLPKSYWWEVLDYTTGKFDTTRKSPYFTLSKHPFSGGRTDTLNVQKNGKYIIRLMITNDANCDREYLDTIDVNSVLRVDLAMQNDTFHCRGGNLVLYPKVSGNGAPVKYDWSDGSSSDSLLIQLHDTVLWEGLRLTITDTGGCTAWDSIDVLNRPNPTIDPIKDKVSCATDSVLFIANGDLAAWNDPRDINSPAVSQGSFLNFNWFFNKKIVGTDTQHRARNVGLYEVHAIDSLGCSASTTVRFIATSVVMPLDKDVCIDDGTIDLRKEEFSGHSGGNWYCPKYPDIIRDKRYFETDSVLSLGSFVYELYYDYVYAPTGCTITDSFTIRVNLLPVVRLRDGYFCQNKNVVNFTEDKIILQPGGATLPLGRQTWKCVDCGSYDEKKIIEDLGTGLPGAKQSFVANIDATTIPLGAKNTDSITLELAFTDAFGCVNRDTTKLVIDKVPKITFTQLGDLCWDEGMVDLKTRSSVLPVNGYWKAIDSTGYAPAADLNQALNSDTLSYDNLNTRNTPKPVADSSLTYIMRYYHDASGCPNWRDTTLTIHGLPTPIIDRNDLMVNSLNEPFTLCELSDTINLSANYAGGVWTSGQPLTLNGAEFIPANVSTYNQPFYLQYSYTDLNGCGGKDSVQVEIHERHFLTTSNDTALTGFDDPTTVNLKATYKNGAGLLWLPLTGGTIDDPSATNVIFSMQGKQDTMRLYWVYVSTQESATNVCPFIEHRIKVQLHPTPCTDIRVDYDITGKKVDLAPSNENLKSYSWKMGSLWSTDVKPNFDVSGLTKEVVSIFLVATNELGDTCLVEKALNLKTGNVHDLVSTISYFPNPVVDGFTILLAEDVEIWNAQITMYNQSGVMVLQKHLNSNYVDCSNLSSGIYSFELVQEGERYIGKFLKQ